MQLNLDQNALQKEVITLSGALNVHAMDDVRRLFDIMAMSEALELEVDLSNVDKLDASGVGALVFLFKRLKGAKRHLKITGVHGQPEAIIRLLRMDKTIETVFLN